MLALVQADHMIKITSKTRITRHRYHVYLHLTPLGGARPFRLGFFITTDQEQRSRLYVWTSINGNLVALFRGYDGEDLSERLRRVVSADNTAFFDPTTKRVRKSYDWATST
jgi:hypothetical protein